MIQRFTDSRCLRHLAPPGYPECPERLEGILDLWRRRGHDVIDAGPHGASVEMIRAVHDPEYVERFARAVERGDGLLDSADNPLCADTWTAVEAAVDASLGAADWVMAGEDRHAFVAVRPPGHHAEHAQAMGFCFFDTVAVAAEYLRRHHGVERLAIFDFDVHHGNGTQHLFEDRADIAFASVHQFPFYPGTGAATELGRGDGKGATVNVPLPAGSGDDAYAEAFDDEILPALRRLEPEVLLLSAGFDAWRGDPLGGMVVSAEAYARWGEILRQLAGELCRGRSLSLLEGGYDLTALPQLVEAYLGSPFDLAPESEANGESP